jgi:hypothetical protein
LLVLRTAFGLAMTKNGQRIPQRGGSLCRVTGPWNRVDFMVGVARARKMHRGKYRELTLSRQRGESGRKATLLPTRIIGCLVIVRWRPIGVGFVRRMTQRRRDQEDPSSLPETFVAVPSA